MKKIVKYLFLVLLFFTDYKMEAKDPFPLYEKYADQITNSFIDEMKKKYKVHCCGSGGCMPHDVEGLDIGFVAFRPSTLQEARELQVSLIEELAKKINAHEKIRPFLREYPFTQKRIGIFIAFKKKDGSRFYQDGIDFVTNARNTIYYQKYDPLTDNYIDFYEEPYEEALRIIQGNYQSN